MYYTQKLTSIDMLAPMLLLLQYYYLVSNCTLNTCMIVVVSVILIWLNFFIHVLTWKKYSYKNGDNFTFQWYDPYFHWSNNIFNDKTLWMIIHYYFMIIIQIIILTCSKVISILKSELSFVMTSKGSDFLWL